MFLQLHVGRENFDLAPASSDSYPYRLQGFYCGTEDGDWGGTTEKALQLFLKDAGYDVDFKKGVRDGGKNTELFQEFLRDEDQDCKPDGEWGKKSAMALQNFLKNEDESEFPSLYKGSLDLCRMYSEVLSKAVRSLSKLAPVL